MFFLFYVTLPFFVYRYWCEAHSYKFGIMFHIKLFAFKGIGVLFFITIFYTHFYISLF